MCRYSTDWGVPETDIRQAVPFLPPVQETNQHPQTKTDRSTTRNHDYSCTGKYHGECIKISSLILL